MDETVGGPVALTTARPEITHFFRLLADETRVRIVRLLSITDLRAHEIGAAVQAPPSAVSYHLKQLRTLGLLRERRSAADARDVYYHLALDRLTQLYTAGGDTLYPGLSTTPDANAHDHAQPAEATSPPLRILFLCTHNSARSQLAEAIMRAMGSDQVEAFSAGSEPTEVAPEAIIVLRALGLDSSRLVAKSLTTFIGQQFDYIITVCDRVRDVCPVFPGDPEQIHWSFADPAVIEDPAQRLQAFREVAIDLQTRIRYLLLLPHPRTGRRLRPHR
ncbi:MAG TPA: metalloregulator ArsR/SmtB family transcription factor [Ktedonobacterales bacterium]|nr:metalloregulator ArsR/SmtB family transcription factor [Ktedonobacterales bacterium]